MSFENATKSATNNLVGGIKSLSERSVVKKKAGGCFCISKKSNGNKNTPDIDIRIEKVAQKKQ